VLDEQLAEQVGDRHTHYQADHAPDQADDERFADDESPYLAGSGAERPQHGALAPTLRDGERKR
jgi:hypothetical protein